MNELICFKRNKPIPKYPTTDYCNTCEHDCPETFEKCLERLGGVIFENGIQLTLINTNKWSN